MYFQWMIWTIFMFIQCIQSNKFNVSYTELQFCKEYDVKSGYKYSTFFRIDSLKPNRNKNNADIILNLKLFVLASKDAHILLSPTDQIKSSPIYEIVLGAGGNTFNEIRRQRQKDPLKTIKKTRFLSPTDVMPLTIQIVKPGNISVAITGQDPFITAFDPNVLDIKYLSFSTWGDAEGKWFYDCEDEPTKSRLEPIEQILTDKQRLLKYLFRDKNYDPTQAPYDLKTLMLDFDLGNANFDAKKSFMESHGRFRGNWIDTQLVWNKKEFGQLSTIRFQNVVASQYIWTPQLRLLNGKDRDFISLPLTYAVVVYSNGSVWVESTETTLMTWCFNSNRNWPQEVIKCNIQIQLAQFSNITLLPMDKPMHIIPRHPTSYDYDEGEWHLEAVRTSKTIFFFDDAYAATHQHVLNVETVLQRNFEFYNHLISAPLIGAFLLVLQSFWVERFLRIMLNAFSLTLLVVMLLVFAEHGPNTYTPTIVSYYVGALYLVWVSLLSFTFRCWFKEQRPNIKLLNQIAASSYAQFLFVTDIFDPYAHPDTEEENVNDFSKFIDRLLFIIFSMIFLICTSIGYY